MANISIELSDDTLPVKGDVQVALREILGRVFHLSLKELDTRHRRDWRILTKIYPSLEPYIKVAIVLKVSSLCDYETLKADVTETFKKHWKMVISEMREPLFLSLLLVVMDLC